MGLVAHMKLRVKALVASCLHIVVKLIGIFVIHIEVKMMEVVVYIEAGEVGLVASQTEAGVMGLVAFHHDIEVELIEFAQVVLHGEIERRQCYWTVVSASAAVFLEGAFGRFLNSD